LTETKPYFLDASTLIHAVDKASKYHKECLNIITKAAKGEITTTTSLETLEETLFILSKLTTPPTAIRITQDYLKMTKIKKTELTRSIFEYALEIMETTPMKRPKDAINVATMLQHNIKTIISEDKDYDDVKLIQRTHPKNLQL
jgi:predicted nucleic acid-binding protein